MKAYYFILFFIVSSFSFAQNNHIVKTDDGRRVLLKADFTWEYIDAVKAEKVPVLTKELKKHKQNGCSVSDGFKEPRLNGKIQSQLKRGRASIKYVKKKVAKDNNCTLDKVQLLSVSESKQNGVYDFCVDGIKVRYKRVGNAIIKPLF